MKKDNSPVGIKKQIFSIVIFAFLIGFTYYAISRIFSEVNPAELWRCICNSNKIWLVAAIGCMILHIVFEGMSISTIASALGDKVNLKRGVVYASADLYFSAITPSATGGQPASIYFMTKRGGGVSRATTTMIVNVIMYVFSLLCFAIAVLIFKPDLFLKSGKSVIILSSIGFVLAIGLIAICLVFMFSKRFVKVIGLFVIRVFYKFKIYKNKSEKISQFTHLLKEYRTCVGHIKKIPFALVLSFIFNILHRLAYFSVSFCIYKSFNLSGSSYLDLIAAQVVISISVSGAPIPGAVGISEMVLFRLSGSIFNKLTPFAVVLTRTIGNYLCYIVSGIISFIEQLSISKLSSDEIKKNKRDETI